MSMVYRSNDKLFGHYPLSYFTKTQHFEDSLAHFIEFLLGFIILSPTWIYCPLFFILFDLVISVVSSRD
jgi:hypothetical protein